VEPSFLASEASVVRVSELLEQIEGRHGPGLATLRAAIEEVLPGAIGRKLTELESRDQRLAKAVNAALAGVAPEAARMACGEMMVKMIPAQLVAVADQLGIKAPPGSPSETALYLMRKATQPGGPGLPALVAAVELVAGQGEVRWLSRDLTKNEGKLEAKLAQVTKGQSDAALKAGCESALSALLPVQLAWVLERLGRGEATRGTTVAAAAKALVAGATDTEALVALARAIERESPGLLAKGLRRSRAA
jgi:hypothetical protein